MDSREILDLTLAQIIDPLIVCFTFCSTVPADVVVNSVVVAFAVGPVVLFVVRSWSYKVKPS